MVNLYGTAREFYTPTENDHIVGRSPMICGQSEAQIRKYHKYIGKSGKIWLVADQPNSADNIYVEGGENSRGFGGSTLAFPLVEGGEIKLKGPWHSNDSALLHDTGIDLQDKYYTIAIIGKRVEYGEHYETIICDILHKDEDWVLGSFHRGDIIGRELACNLGHRVFVGSESQGGASYHYVEPDAVFYWEKNHSIIDVSPSQASIILS